jgi:hypothetical protein
MCGARVFQPHMIKPALMNQMTIEARSSAIEAEIFFSALLVIVINSFLFLCLYYSVFWNVCQGVFSILSQIISAIHAIIAMIAIGKRNAIFYHPFHFLEILRFL